MRVVVLGAGVVGLSAAVRLREAGIAADVWAERTSPDTTSDVAAALWYPYRAGPEQSVTRWAAETYAEFARLAATEPAAGVRMVAGRELFRAPVDDPWWRPAVPDLARVPAALLPPGYADGYAVTVPVADTSRHLPWLARRFARLGGTVVRRRVGSLDQALADADAVVVAAGLGAGELVGDPTVVPVRGQVLRVAPCGVTEWVVDAGDPLGYVVPRAHDVVLGGTAEVGATDLAPDPVAESAMLARCAVLEPRIAGARILGRAVGLRPARPAVRLEAEWHGGRLVVHDYGHGGAGVTLAWGCAGDVVRLVRENG